MSKENFTQGEWRAEIEDHSFCDTGDYITTFGIVTGKNQSIAECFDTGKINEEEAEANCHLISAAPNMYRVLSGICGEKSARCCNYAPESCKVCSIKKALEKARGEE
jgi:hypothetical protein